MKIEVPKKKIQEVVSRTEKVAEKNAALPVLKCIHMEAKNKMLTVKATNLELGLEMHIPISIVEEGAVAVPGSVFNSFIANLPDDSMVTVETDGENLRVSTPNSSTVIKTMPTEEFPIIPTVEDGEVFTVDAADFAKGLKSVWWSAAVSSMKPELSSVYVYTDEEEIVFVATDSFRVSEKRVKAKVSRDFGHILIPVKNIPEILRILDAAKGDIEVNASKNQLSISYENVYLVSRVIDGTFPDYKQIIPKGFKTEAIILKQDLMNSLKLASVFSDKFNQLNINVSPKKKKFELTTRNSDIGESTNNIENSSSGEDITLNVAYKYFSDSFQSIDSESLSIQFNGLGRPIVIKGVSDPSFVYVMMPMNK
ncbi:MAG TPA: DNA polymerase III subunit beta [Candidatus Paceibacterota bacterium]|nr:DNA polymerase III subunit beta [Candidatus Paceibacterota bacterium]